MKVIHTDSDSPLVRDISNVNFCILIQAELLRLAWKASCKGHLSVVLGEAGKWPELGVTAGWASTHPNLDTVDGHLAANPATREGL